MKGKTKLCMMILTVLLLPGIACAGDAAIFQEYHTYGGTGHIIADAFQKVALITSSGAYKGLFFGIIVLSFIIGGIGVVFRGADKLEIGPGQWIKWFMTMIFSVIVYFVFVNQTDTLFIYDETTNSTLSVDGVPDGIITIAGLANKIETGMIELIDTSSLTGFSYRDSAGGVVIGALYNLLSGDKIPLSEWDMYSRRTLDAFVKDCVLWDGLAGTDVMNQLENPPGHEMETLLQSAGEWENIYTDVYSAAYPQGECVTCSAAYLTLHNKFVELSSGINTGDSSFVKTVCSGAGFDVSNGAHVTMCKNWLLNSMNTLLGGMPWGMYASGGLASSEEVVGIDNIMKNRIIAETILDYTGNASWLTRTQAEINQRQVSMGIGAGIAANDYVPIMKAAIIAIFVGMTPLLMLLIPTPLFGKVLGVICGGFCFLSLWGVSDAVVNSYVMDYASQAISKAMHGENLGVSNITFLAPQALLKTTAVFGYMRTSAVMLAGAFSAILFRFGGYMLGQFVGGAMGHIKAAGKAEGYQTLRDTGEDLSSAVTSNAMAQTVSQNRAQWGGQYLDKTAQKDVISQAEAIAGGQAKMDAIPGSAVSVGNRLGTATGRGAVMGAGETTGKWGARSQVGDPVDVSENVGQQETWDRDAKSLAMAGEGANWDNHYIDKGAKMAGRELENILLNRQEAEKLGVGMLGYGRLIGIRDAAVDSGGARRGGLGFDTISAEERQKAYPVSAFLQFAANDILNSGRISDNTNGVLSTINSTDEGRAAFLGNANMSGRISNEDEAANFLAWGRAAGMRGLDGKEASDLVGSEFNLKTAWNEGSGLGVVGGRVGSDYVYSDTTTHDQNIETSKARGGALMVGDTTLFARDYNSESREDGSRIEKFSDATEQGGGAIWNGVQVTDAEGNNEIKSLEVRGIMKAAEDGNMGTLAYENEYASRVAAQQLGKEVSGLFKGDMSRSREDAWREHFKAALGASSPNFMWGLAKISGEMGFQGYAVQSDKDMSASDLVTAYSYSVMNDDSLTAEQKNSKLQELMAFTGEYAQGKGRDHGDPSNGLGSEKMPPLRDGAENQINDTRNYISEKADAIKGAFDPISNFSGSGNETIKKHSAFLNLGKRIENGPGMGGGKGDSVEPETLLASQTKITPDD